MVCNDCCFYHPYRDRICSIIPRMEAEQAGRMEACDCRLTVPDAVMEARRVTETEQRRRWHPEMEENETGMEDGHDQDITG